MLSRDEETKTYRSQSIHLYSRDPSSQGFCRFTRKRVNANYAPLTYTFALGSSAQLYTSARTSGLVRKSHSRVELPYSLLCFIALCAFLGRYRGYDSWSMAFRLKGKLTLSTARETIFFSTRAFVCGRSVGRSNDDVRISWDEKEPFQGALCTFFSRESITGGLKKYRKFLAGFRQKIYE